jgi:hypothetical protein
MRFVNRKLKYKRQKYKKIFIKLNNNIVIFIKEEEKTLLNFEFNAFM